MYQYLLRRLLITVPTVLGISGVLFSILALAPGDPFEELALNPDIPAEVRLQLRHQFGLDDALPLRYLHWLTAMLRGEWGYSFASRVSVVALIWQRLPTTLFVLGSAYGLALCIALPVGIVSAVKPYSLFDHLATTGAFVGHSLPTFFTGLLFILLFSLHLGWLPFIYSTTIEARGLAWISAHLRQAAMPIAVLRLFEAAALTCYVRAAFLSLKEKEFVEAARCIGVPDGRLIVRHILPNTLSLVIVAATLGVGSAILTESSLSFLGLGFPPDTPTWGRLLADARDYLDIAPHWALGPGVMIFLAVLSINYIGDGLRDALDPRRAL